MVLCLWLLLCPADLELIEGLDVSKHGERAMCVKELVKELDASVHGARKADDSVTVTAV
jgi:hypothetical protein